MSIQEEKLRAIADAIRAMDGSAAPIPAKDFPDRIRAILTGMDTSDATATAADLLSGKTAYGPEGKIIGAMPSVEQAAPGISVSSAGLITASAAQTAGYVSAGTRSATKQLTVQAAKTVTPAAYAQTAVASGRYTTGAVSVAGDSNLAAGNIRSGVSIFGVAGTYEGGTQLQSYNITVQNSSSYAVSVYYTSVSGSLQTSPSISVGGIATIPCAKNTIFAIICENGRIFPMSGSGAATVSTYGTNGNVLAFTAYGGTMTTSGSVTVANGY